MTIILLINIIDLFEKKIAMLCSVVILFRVARFEKSHRTKYEKF